MKHMIAEREHYEPFLAEDFDLYIERKSKLGVYGNNAELQAIGELFNRPIEVYRDDCVDAVNLFHDAFRDANAPLRLSYHGSCHYNALIDPKAPAFGVGLGLPGPRDASEAEQAIVETALRDNDATALDDQLVRQAVLDLSLIHI